MASLSGGLSGAASGAQAGMMFGPYGAAIGAVAGGLLGAFGGGGAKHVQQRGYTPADYTLGQQQFLQQGKNIGDVSNLLNEANKIDNLAYRQQAQQFAPNLFGNIAQNAQTTSNFLGGNLSSGIQYNLGKDNATARDLGMTPYQLQIAGANRVGNEGATARELTPFNEMATDTLLSPAALLKRQDQLDLHNNQILNQQKLLAAGVQATNPLGVGAAAGLGSLFGNSNLRGLGSSNISGDVGYGFSGGPGTDLAGNQVDWGNMADLNSSFGAGGSFGGGSFG